MRTFASRLFVALLGLTLLCAPAAAQTTTTTTTTTTGGYPPQATTAPQAVAEVIGVSGTVTGGAQPPIAVGGVALNRDTAGAGSVRSALARTGSDTEALARTALLALAAGGATMLAARRRPQH